MPVDPNDLDHFFDRENLQEYLDEVKAELMRSFEIGALREGITKSQAHDRAVQYASEHAGQLIEGIDEYTRSTVKGLVASAIDNGNSLNQLMKSLDESGAFGKQRATTIARTETTTAHGQGARQAASLEGRDEKSWIRNEYIPDDECTDNEDAGWIGIDELFPSGADTVPEHPNCECDVIYRTATLAEVEEEGEGE